MTLLTIQNIKMNKIASPRQSYEESSLNTITSNKLNIPLSPFQERVKLIKSGS